MSGTLLRIDDSESVTARSIKRKLNSLARDIYGTSTSGNQASEDAAHLPIFQARLERARLAWTQFREVWDSLDKAYVKAGEDSKFPTDHDQLFYTSVTDEIDFSNGYAIICEKSERPNLSGTDLHASCMNHSTSRHLPRITLPSFNGDLMSWKSFSDTFKTLVHDDPNLTRIEKFNYLKNSLKGEASTLIIKVPVTDETYDQAWQMLQSAYANPRVLATHYIKQALEYRPHNSKPSLETYQSYLSGVVDNIESFKALQLKDPTDFLLTLISLRALDSETRKEFELANLDTEFPIADDVFSYIRNRMKALKLSSNRESLNFHQNSNPSSGWKASKQNFPNRNSLKYSGSSFHTSSAPPAGPRNSVGSGWQKRRQSPSKERRAHTRPCPFCQLDHELYRCFKFAGLAQQKRSDFIKAWKGCINCLREGHGVKECPSKFACRYCQRRHHSLLHEGDKINDNPSSSAACGSNFHAKQNPSAPASRLVLFGTAQVIIRSSSGRVHMARAALDSCSQYTFISKSLAEKLQCNIVDTFEGGLTGLGDVSLNHPSGVTDCSIFGDGKEFPIDAVVIDAITARMPSNPVPTRIIEEVTSHLLADPHFGRPAPIDILIGGDIYPQLLVGAPIKTMQPNILLLPTVFGLVVTGSTLTKASSEGRVMMISNAVPKLEEMLKRFWELEEPEHHARHDPEDNYCRQHFEENTSRDETGRFTVKLPIKPDSEPCGNNRGLAARRFFNLERRLQRDPELREHYLRFMREYADLGHMTTASSPVDYIIPHHGIWQGAPGNRKLRVVFDASCPSPSTLLGDHHLSLNDTLFPGPKVQPDISDILTRFRLFSIALTADIVKMYRQILLHPEQRNLQHIFWREDPSQPLVEMELNTLTYGESPCSFLAISTVSRLARENSEKLPLASSKVLKSMYVDDFVSGADAMEEALQLKSQLIQLFGSGGFALGKWSSNVSSLVPNGENLEIALPMSSSEDSIVKILGLVWDPRSDQFTYSVIAPEAKATKRLLLSSIARVFDPLGFLSPVIFKAKCLIQALWKEKLDWDDPLPRDLSESWGCIAREWLSLENVVVPRHITWPQCKRSLVGFSDASERGYAAAVYLRSEKDGAVKVHLIRAKTKVAPTKFVSIARLELCGALLLSRLISTVNVPGCDSKDNRCFTDSMVVLAWLRCPTYKLNTFEANRVTSIFDLSPLHCWRHVRSGENPSDLASRGCTPSQLIDCSIWWRGPHWLKETIESWPVEDQDVASTSVQESNQALVTVSGEKTEENFILNWFERFSSLRLLVRTVVRILRFLRINHFKEPTAPITSEEYHLALTRCVIITQQNLLPQRVCDAGSKLCPFKELSPFADKDGVVRVGGRLKEAPLPHSHMHPALLPRDSRLSYLIVTDVHDRNLHPGPTLTGAIFKRPVNKLAPLFYPNCG